MNAFTIESTAARVEARLNELKAAALYTDQLRSLVEDLSLLELEGSPGPYAFDLIDRAGVLIAKIGNITDELDEATVIG